MLICVSFLDHVISLKCENIWSKKNDRYCNGNVMESSLSLNWLNDQRTNQNKTWQSESEPMYCWPVTRLLQDFSMKCNNTGLNIMRQQPNR